MFQFRSMVAKKEKKFGSFLVRVEALTSIVNDVLDDSLDVSVALGVVEVAELGRVLVQACDGLCREC